MRTRRQYRYSVYYEFSPGKPPPLAALFPKSSDEIVYALSHFKDDVAHHLLDFNAEVITSDLLPGSRLAVTIRTSADQAEVEAAVTVSCRALGLRATRVGGVEVE